MTQDKTQDERNHGVLSTEVQADLTDRRSTTKEENDHNIVQSSQHDNSQKKKPCKRLGGQMGSEMRQHGLST